MTDRKRVCSFAIWVVAWCAASIVSGIYHFDIQRFAINHPLKFTAYFSMGGATFALILSHILYGCRYENKDEQGPRNGKQDFAKLCATSLLAFSLIFSVFGGDCRKFIEMDGSMVAFVASGLLAGGLGYYGFIYRSQRDHGGAIAQYTSPGSKNSLKNSNTDLDPTGTGDRGREYPHDLLSTPSLYYKAAEVY